ncbi:hypothetical protein CVT25_003202 [Psilocybe cyanescens]|uniref:6S proteasome subunit Rpn6 C-terminal helix domain-containing protein n=1 Tax=Psilocybe cyanescens TaxID=93625 RepID=A0A409X5T3_PSICY|nr:hypothetical protein CVT25_003202 [Psilocybe cyanescens]
MLVLVLVLVLDLVRFSVFSLCISIVSQLTFYSIQSRLSLILSLSNANAVSRCLHHLVISGSLPPPYRQLRPEDVNALLSIKLALRYASSRDVESMRAGARAHQKRDLRAFQGMLREYRVDFGGFNWLVLGFFSVLVLVAITTFLRLCGALHSDLVLACGARAGAGDEWVVSSAMVMRRLSRMYMRDGLVLSLGAGCWVTAAARLVGGRSRCAVPFEEKEPTPPIPLRVNCNQTQRSARISPRYTIYDALFEGNLKKIVELYLVVEVAYVAELSTMILDKVLYGVLDQGRGCLVIYDEPKADISLLFFLLLLPLLLHFFLNTCGAAIETLEQISKVVESLYAKKVFNLPDLVSN